MMASRYSLFLFLVTAVSCTQQRAFSADALTYLPLQKIKHWTLESRTSGMKMDFIVEGQHDGAYNVRWRNPWVQATFGFRPSGAQVLLQTLDMGNGTASMPGGTLYFDFAAPSGTKWSNVIGKLKVISTDQTVATPSGTFQNCIGIEATDKGGSKTFWYFAPEVGFVQFGQGPGAFVLTAYDRAGGDLSSKEVALPRIRPGTSPPSLAHGLYLGLESNPTPAQGYSFEAKRDSFSMSHDSGVNMVFVGPKWNELEPKAGRYDFKDVDERVRIARQFGAVVLVNLRVIDTNSRAVPKDYEKLRWDDPKLQAKLVSALGALAGHLSGLCRWVTVGNEVNEYFSKHGGEIGAYANLISSVKPQVNSIFPGTPFTVNFTSTAVGELHSKYSAIVSQLDLYSINFYPINADFSFRDPSVAAKELKSILDALSDRPILFQELGYPSSAVLGSSEQRQADFLTQVLQVLSQNRNRIVGANFNWRSDLPDSVTKDLTKYYGLENSGNFRAFLGSLGWFKTDGTPKMIWYAFQKQAPVLLGAKGS